MLLADAGITITEMNDGLVHALETAVEGPIRENPSICKTLQPAAEGCGKLSSVHIDRQLHSS